MNKYASRAFSDLNFFELLCFNIQIYFKTWFWFQILLKKYKLKYYGWFNKEEDKQK